MGNPILTGIGKACGRVFWATLSLLAVYLGAGVAWVNTRSTSMEILGGLAALAFIVSLRHTDSEEEHAEILAEIHKLRKELSHGKEACCKDQACNDSGSKDQG